MALRPKLDQNACLNAVAYLAQRLDRPGKFHLTHLLYLAEKRHLEEYGRFICGDDYFALQHGPVPTTVLDMLNVVTGERTYDNRQDLVEQFRRTFEAEEGFDYYTFTVVEEPDFSVLSESDIECLQEVLDKYGKYSFQELKHLTHDEAYKATRAEQQHKPIPVERIVGTLRDSDLLLEHLSDPHPG